MVNMHKKSDMKSDKAYACLWFEDEEMDREDLLFLEELFGVSEDSDMLIQTSPPVLHC